MLIVSHDRYFLDKVVNKIFERARAESRHTRQLPAVRAAAQDAHTSRSVKAWEAQKGTSRSRRLHSPRPLRPADKQAASRQKQLDRLEAWSGPR